MLVRDAPVAEYNPARLAAPIILPFFPQLLLADRLLQTVAIYYYPFLQQLLLILAKRVCISYLVLLSI